MHVGPAVPQYPGRVRRQTATERPPGQVTLRRVAPIPPGAARSTLPSLSGGCAPSRGSACPPPP
jgi:hypothetical protein